MKKNLGKKIIALIVGILWIFGAYTGYQHLYRATDTASTTETKGTIRIGYQRGDIFNLARIEGSLEEELNAAGYKVKWKQFTDGTSLLEALIAGSVDYGRTGNTPPVVSQANGSDIVYIAASSSKASGSAILTASDSDISSVADLKGKKVAVNKGSSGEYFLVKALEKAGLTEDDVDLQYLDPSEGRIALSNGKVDAWAVWDPYTAAAQVEMDAKTITTADGYSTDRDFILSTKKFASSNTDVSEILVTQMTEALDWVNTNKTTVAKKLAKTLGISAKVSRKMVNRRTYGMDTLSNAIMAEQQDIADTWYENGFIDKQIDVTDALVQSDD